MPLIGEHNNDGVNETDERNRGHKRNIYLVEEACCASSGE